jgi:HK97 family phage portal protein
MHVLGLNITRKAPSLTTKQAGVSSVTSRGGWWSRIYESFAGAWQSNTEVKVEDVLTYGTVFACVSLIASDISKLRLKYVEETDDGVRVEKTNPAYSPVLRRPNHYQGRIPFVMSWMISKLVHGNTYVLKQRDQRGVVNALYVLDPTRVTVLVSTTGDVFYQLQQDDLSKLPTGGVIVPAREIIHDVSTPLYHPLVGLSPISACGLAALQGLRIQKTSLKFFENGARPSGILTAPGGISEQNANEIKAYWAQEFSGSNVGKVAVLGDGLTYTATPAMTSTDAQLVEQLNWTSQHVCSTYKVPPHMVAVGPQPTYNNVQALTVGYYSQCLQHHIESIEELLVDGLGMSSWQGVEFDLDALFAMDTRTLTEAAKEGIGSGAMSPNEARKRYFNLPPVPGGDTPYLQQQNYSLEALAKRDAAPPTPAPVPPSTPAPVPPSTEGDA